MPFLFVSKGFSLQRQVEKDPHMFWKANVCELYSTQIQKYKDFFAEIDEIFFQNQLRDKSLRNI